MRVFKKRYSPIFIEEDYHYRRRGGGGFLMKSVFVLASFGFVIGLLYFFLP